MSHFLDCHRTCTDKTDTQINLENDFKNLLYFCDLVLNLKVKSQLTEVKFHLKLDISLTSRWIFIRLACIYHCDWLMICLMLGDLDLIFKVMSCK